MKIMSKKNDENKECPLCMEAYELDDISFFPCTCGYQICRFCWHRIRTNENSLCPACRKQYTEDPATFKPLTAEEFQKIKDEKKLKDQLKKQKVSEKRKHLGNLRVVQKNLVFVVGLPIRLAEIEELRKPTYFGKFGKISKVIVNQCTSYAGSQGPSASAYITYYKSDDALRAIQAVNNTKISGKTLKASLGTTKYCSNFLRKLKCPKMDCMYLHDIGDESGSFTKEEMQAGKHQEYEQRLHEQLLAQTKKPASPICQLDFPVTPQKETPTCSKRDESPVINLLDSPNSESAHSTVDSPLCDVSDLCSESPNVTNEMCSSNNSSAMNSFTAIEDSPQPSATAITMQETSVEPTSAAISSSTAITSKSEVSQSSPSCSAKSFGGSLNAWQSSDFQNYVSSSQQPSNHSKTILMGHQSLVAQAEVPEKITLGRIFHDGQHGNLLSSSRLSPTLHPQFTGNCVSPVKRNLSLYTEGMDMNHPQPQTLVNNSELSDFLSANQAKLGSVSSAFAQRNNSMGIPVRYPGNFSLNDASNSGFNEFNTQNTVGSFGQNSMQSLNSIQNHTPSSLSVHGQKLLNSHGQNPLSSHRLNPLSNHGQSFVNNHVQNPTINQRQPSLSIHGQNIPIAHTQSKLSLASHAQSSLSSHTLSNHGQSSIGIHGQKAMGGIVQNTPGSHMQNPYGNNHGKNLLGQNLMNIHGQNALSSHGQSSLGNYGVMINYGQNSTAQSPIVGHNQNVSSGSYSQARSCQKGLGSGVNNQFGIRKNPCQNGLIGLMHNNVHRYGPNSVISNAFLNREEQEDDLGFDPFEESVKGLAELIAQEDEEKIKVDYQGKSSISFLKAPFFTEDSSSLRSSSVDVLQAAQHQQYQMVPPPGFSVSNSSLRPAFDTFSKKAMPVVNAYDHSSAATYQQDAYSQSNSANFNGLHIGDTSVRSHIPDWQAGASSTAQRNFNSSHSPSSHNLSQLLSPLPAWSTATDSENSPWIAQDQQALSHNFTESANVNTKLEKMLQQMKLEQAAKLQNPVKYNAFSAY